MSSASGVHDPRGLKRSRKGKWTVRDVGHAASSLGAAPRRVAGVVAEDPLVSTRNLKTPPPPPPPPLTAPRSPPPAPRPAARAPDGGGGLREPADPLLPARAAPAARGHHAAGARRGKARVGSGSRSRGAAAGASARGRSPRAPAPLTDAPPHPTAAQVRPHAYYEEVHGRRPDRQKDLQVRHRLNAPPPRPPRDRARAVSRPPAPRPRGPRLGSPLPRPPPSRPRASDDQSSDVSDKMFSAEKVRPWSWAFGGGIYLRIATVRGGGDR